MLYQKRGPNSPPFQPTSNISTIDPRQTSSDIPKGHLNDNIWISQHPQAPFQNDSKTTISTKDYHLRGRIDTNKDLPAEPASVVPPKGNAPSHSSSQQASTTHQQASTSHQQASTAQQASTTQGETPRADIAFGRLASTAQPTNTTQQGEQKNKITPNNSSRTTEDSRQKLQESPSRLSKDTEPVAASGTTYRAAEKDHSRGISTSQRRGSNPRSKTSSSPDLADKKLGDPTVKDNDNHEGYHVIPNFTESGRDERQGNHSPYVRRVKKLLNPSWSVARSRVGASEPISYAKRLIPLDDDAVSIRKTAGWIPSIPSTISSGFSRLFKPGSRMSTITPQKAYVGENDIVIAVTGRVSGEDKRWFTDDAIGDNNDSEDVSSPEVHYVASNDSTSPNRKIFLVYTTGGKEQKLNDALRSVQGWFSDSCAFKRKFSGLIYLEDTSTAPPIKLSRHALELLDKCVDRPNIVVSTIGWNDEIDTKPLENRHKELIEQWRTFVDRGVNVLRLSAPGTISRDVCHTPWDIVKLIITRNDEKAPVQQRGIWKAKEKKAEDRFLDDPRDTDIVIPIMGPTGAGKSTFINAVYGSNVAVVGHNLKSETAQLQHVILSHPTDRTRRIIIVDTPGFDDTYVADSEILRRIAVWLARSYSANMTLAGVIYLHEISQTRMLGTARKNLDMFNKLIGEAATKNVVLATTKWDDIPKEVGERREQQLSERHWKWMVDLGAKIFRFENAYESGWKIIQHILDQVGIQDVDTVEIQKELVEVKKILPDTEAGQALLYTLEELLENQRQQAAQLRQDEASDQVKVILHETDQKIRATLSQINELSGNRLKAWWKKFSWINREAPHKANA